MPSLSSDDPGPFTHSETPSMSTQPPLTAIDEGLSMGRYTLLLHRARCKMKQIYEIC